MTAAGTGAPSIEFRAGSRGCIPLRGVDGPADPKSLASGPGIDLENLENSRGRRPCGAAFAIRSRRRLRVRTQAKRQSADRAPIEFFESKRQWAAWLEKNHRTSAGLWLRLAKKDSGFQSVTYKEALEVALCYGWIDGQKRPESEAAWLQRFLARSDKSVWSKINREKALALIASGEMKAAGLEAVASARKNGRWDTAYDSPRAAVVPEDLQVALQANPRAAAFFESLDRANRYAVLWRIQTVKRAETRARKIAQFVAMLERKEKLHP